MRVSSCHSHVRLPINCIVVPKGSEPLEDTIALGGVTSCYIQHQVDKAVIWVVHVANDKCPGVEPLSQAGADLAQIGVASELNLYDRARDISLAYTNAVTQKVSVSAKLQSLCSGARRTEIRPLRKPALWMPRTALPHRHCRSRSQPHLRRYGQTC